MGGGGSKWDHVHGGRGGRWSVAAVAAVFAGDDAAAALSSEQPGPFERPSRLTLEVGATLSPTPLASRITRDSTVATMKAPTTSVAATVPSTAPVKARRKSMKKSDRSVPFAEMQRLMRVYGSIKCHRKRSSGPEENMKIDSVKRKFYRWFPDFDEKFEKDPEASAGGNVVYRPKAGHEAEMSYREEMRRLDGEVLCKKRAKCRRERHGTKLNVPSITTSGRISPPPRRVSSGSVNAKLAAPVSPVQSSVAPPTDVVVPEKVLSAPKPQAVVSRANPITLYRQVTPDLELPSQVSRDECDDGQQANERTESSGALSLDLSLNDALDTFIDQDGDMMTDVFDEVVFEEVETAFYGSLSGQIKCELETMESGLPGLLTLPPPPATKSVSLPDVSDSDSSTGDDSSYRCGSPEWERDWSTIDKMIGNDLEASLDRIAELPVLRDDVEGDEAVSSYLFDFSST
ncbi:hypothetical protein THAOC_22057 [Thalassiosira oceanica]|uniref:Uncharacterized protein n=1 Tax=Thalassiosira oceanica TaxID=159749 RepID=K0RVK4_THAOC|nr:hypothetical protein THAOC_22057 [Thalassiosira oceanica]|eukprot:EJK57853.1 hypothetical protein THAOC_22057 [Thalassiosira oceanica]